MHQTKKERSARQRIATQFLLVAAGALMASACTEAAAPTAAGNREGPRSQAEPSAATAFARAFALTLQSTRHRLSLAAIVASTHAAGAPVDLHAFLFDPGNQEFRERFEQLLFAEGKTAATHLDSLDGFGLEMRSLAHRRSWQEGNELLVAAIATGSGARYSRQTLRAFDSRGNLTLLDSHSPSALPVLTLRLLATEDRERSKELTNRLLTSGQEGYAFDFGGESCDPMTAIIPCEPDTGSGSVPAGPEIQVSPACGIDGIYSASASNDQDSDGIRDDCETELAAAFAPMLALHETELFRDREPYWLVQRQNYFGTNIPGQLTILYLVSYYYDGPPFDHQGDSEFIQLLLRPGAGSSWTINYAFLSAHWQAPMDESRFVPGDQLQYLASPGGPRPTIYVSRSHHANYESASRCNARFGDHCSSSGATEFIQFYADGNVGSRGVRYDLDASLSGPNDCVRSRYRSTNGRQGVECFFDASAGSSPGKFSGWVTNPIPVFSPGTTHYNTVLSSLGY